ncbi:MAG: hypothetical protein WB767_17440 [Nocardioides sp.]
MRAGASALIRVLTCALLLSACAGGDPPSPPPTGEVRTPEPTRAPSGEASTAPAEPTTPTRNPLADLVEGVELDDDPVLGADISWPQCPKGLGIPEKPTQGSPLPVAEARFVIVGLTNGPGFYPNPCLADQVSYVRSRGLMLGAYAVASFPEAARVARHGTEGPYDGSTRLGALANTGFQQARFNVASMKRAEFLTPAVWIDVEPVPSFEWSGDLEANAAVVAGVARGYEEAGYRIGIYSTPFLWEGVVGDLELGVPEWRAAGQTSASEALDRCGDDWVIQGGQALIGQWVQDNRDMNLTCPGFTDLAAWFHQY